jgi:hypothetical protein
MSGSQLHLSRPCRLVAAGACVVLTVLLAGGSAPLVAQQPVSHGLHAGPDAPPPASLSQTAPAPLFAASWMNKIGVYLSNQANVVRFCVLVMALALFIMLKK